MRACLLASCAQHTPIARKGSQAVSHLPEPLSIFGTLCVNTLSLVRAEVPHGEAGASSKECVCKPGFGSPTGEAPCRMCPTASYSPGGSMEDCK